MKRAIAPADRVASLCLRLIVAANILFLISFLILVGLAVEKAGAATVACKGKDMIAELRASDPALLARIRTEAAATLNGKGILWKLEKAGETPSYLFGTMHMTDSRVTSLPPAAQKAFDAADTVVIETTEVLDQTKMLASIMAEPELMMFTDDTTLTSLLSPEDAALVARSLEARGIPAASVAKMKPWMLSAMVALPACELARKAGGAPVLDVKLAEEAKAQGKRLEGLETVAEQLRAMASLPIAFHLEGLVETLKLGERLDDVTETMIVLYQQQETGMYWPLFEALLPGTGKDKAGYAAFEEAMIVGRNRTMAEHALPILAQGNAFIAVGALHLPGPEGLVELFRQHGYRATALP